MIKIRKTRPRLFDVPEGIPMTIWIGLVSFWILILAFSNIEEDVSYEGKVLYKEENLYKDPPTYMIRVEYDSLQDILEHNVDKKEYESIIVNGPIKKDLSFDDLGKTSLWEILAIFAVLTLLICIGRLILFCVEYLTYFFKNYKIIYISKKKYNLIATIDPYLEEDWKT